MPVKCTSRPVLGSEVTEGSLGSTGGERLFFHQSVDICNMQICMHIKHMGISVIACTPTGMYISVHFRLVTCAFDISHACVCAFTYVCICLHVVTKSQIQKSMC